MIEKATATFEIQAINDLFILLIDQDQGKSVTNAAHRVIDVLEKLVPEGIGHRKVYYKDTMGRIDQLKVKNRRFDGFAPCSESQQRTIIEMKGGDCLVCGEYEKDLINGFCQECQKEHGTLIL